MTYYLMLDVGGTYIKGGIITEHGSLYRDAIHSFDAKAKRSADEIFDNIVQILNVLADQIHETDWSIGGIGMAFPGPFDYERGICLMKGLDKYEAIYGIDISKRVKQGFLTSKNGQRMTPDCKFIFLHDVEAFALGEATLGEASEHRRVFYLCIGTGAGSAFSENHRILKGEDGLVPQNGWIYKAPFKDGIIDDYLSVRGLASLSKEVMGVEMSGAELWEHSRAGDENACQVYSGFGEWLYQGIFPILEKFQPDALVLGGQISKSFEYFGTMVSKACQERGIQIYLTADTSKRTLEGLYIQMQKRKEEGVSC